MAEGPRNADAAAAEGGVEEEAWRSLIVEDDDFVPEFQQTFCQVATDKSGTAGDQAPSHSAFL